MNFERLAPLNLANGGGGAKSEKIAILYENEEWQQGLFDELDRRGLPYVPIHLNDAAFLLDDPPAYPLFVNRVSPSSYLRGHVGAIRAATALIDTLASRGRRVVNGEQSFRLETSKVSQHLVMKSLGVRTPLTAVFSGSDRVRELAESFPFPAILKPDTGGSGAFVRLIQSGEHLAEVLSERDDLFAPDHLLLLQQYIEPVDGAVVRIEFIDGELVYAMKARPTNTFNLCPADACERRPAVGDGSDLPPRVEFEHYGDIPSEAVAQAREIVRAARLDVGGVEYIEDEYQDRYFFDINATSVYRDDICESAGTDALSVLGDFLEREYRKELAKVRPVRVIAVREKPKALAG